MVRSSYCLSSQTNSPKPKDIYFTLYETEQQKHLPFEKLETKNVVFS